MTTEVIAKKPGQDEFVKIKLEEAEQQVEDGELVWINVVSDDAHEIEQLKQFGVRHSVIKDAVGYEQLPKYEAYKDNIYVVLHALTLKDKVLDTTQLDCALMKNLFITVSQSPVYAVTWLWKQAQRPEYGKTATSDQMFGHITELVGQNYLEVMNKFDDLIDEVYDRALTARRNVLSQIQLLRRETTSIAKVTRPQAVLLNDMRRLKHPRLTDDGRSLISDGFDAHNLAVQSLESARSMLADALDTYRGATGERQSTASTVLAVYSAVMLPLTVMGGFYGMNVPLPGEKNNSAWLIITAVMLTTAIASLIVFFRVGFIRWPDLNQAKPNSALARANAAGISGERPLTRQAAAAEKKAKSEGRKEQETYSGG